MEPLAEPHLPFTNHHLPLIVICGPTASGKSELAMKVAQRFNGEIICADSRTVYKGMDIGTVKPSLSDQRKVTHHLLDQVIPGERFTVYDFQQRTKQAIKSIRERHKLPILVGGTGLYIDSVVFNYRFPKTRTSRAKKPNNNRHLATSQAGEDKHPSKRKRPLPNTIIIGIEINMNQLESRIIKRADHIFSSGVIKEAQTLGKAYGWNNEPMTANIYRIAQLVISGEISLFDAKKRSILLDRQLAKRQMTWLRRNSYIRWGSVDNVEKYLFTLLAKKTRK